MNSFLCYVSRDEDLLDGIRPSPTTTADVLIEVAKIQWAAEELRDLTAFLGDFEAFSEIIPVVDTSVNKFIAGEDRTIADLFDYTGKNCDNCYDILIVDLATDYYICLLSMYKSLGKWIKRDSNIFCKYLGFNRSCNSVRFRSYTY